MCTQKKPLFHLHFGLKVPEDKMWSNVTWNNPDQSDTVGK